MYIYSAVALFVARWPAELMIAGWAQAENGSNLAELNLVNARRLERKTPRHGTPCDNISAHVKKFIRLEDAFVLLHCSVAPSRIPLWH